MARFRWHTGAEPKRVADGKHVPVLFRDIGPEAMAQFLSGELRQLAGPMTPITYLRTADYQEPYIDYAKIGRLALLRPMEVQPWHSGVEHIFISAASRMPSSDSLAFIPGTISLSQAALALVSVQNIGELREAFGGCNYDQLCKENLMRLTELNRECREYERCGAPCRRVFQTGSRDAREQLIEKLQRFGLGETDLCTAWHHLPDARRMLLKNALPDLVAKSFAKTRRCDA